MVRLGLFFVLTYPRGKNLACGRNSNVELKHFLSL